MARRLKLLTTLSSAAAASALIVGCGGEGEGEGHGSDATSSNVAASEGEGEGESEGEGAVKPDTKIGYIATLLQIEGHLRAGTALYISGEVEMAALHMKHPGDELYAGVASVFKTYGHKGLADELSSMADAVENGESEDTVIARFDALEESVAEAISSADPTVKDLLLAAHATLTSAGAELEIAIKDGVIIEPHEYQDAHGFILATSMLLAELDSTDGAERDAIDTAREQVGLALAQVPSVSIPTEVTADPSVVFGAAARIELAALGL